MLSFTCLIHLRYSRIVNTSNITYHRLLLLLLFVLIVDCYCCCCFELHSLDNEMVLCAHWNHSELQMKARIEYSYDNKDFVFACKIVWRAMVASKPKTNSIVLLLHCYSLNEWMNELNKYFPIELRFIVPNIDTISIGFVPFFFCFVNVWMNERFPRCNLIATQLAV